MTFGVPQGSNLSPLFFSLLMVSLVVIIYKLSVGFHCYADDTKLYVLVAPDDFSPLYQLETCISANCIKGKRENLF